jgi:hypothetical protein
MTKRRSVSLKGSNPSAQGSAPSATLGNPTQKTPRPEGALSDRRLKDIERLVNCSIHELVICQHHLNQTSPAPGADNSAEMEAASDCLQLAARQNTQLLPPPPR